jgi:hypothetical protein
MSRGNVGHLAFNRGLISPLALARTDIAHTFLSAEIMVNWLPKTQGAMRIRPGTKHLGSSINDTGAVFGEFIASADDTALIELTNANMRVWKDDALISRPTNSQALPDFNTDTGLWTSVGSGGGTIGFGDTGLVLDAVNRGGMAKATQKVSWTDTGDLTDTGSVATNEIAFAINVTRGPVTFSVGKDTGDDNLISETTLRTGRHSLAMYPTTADTGGFCITFQTSTDAKRIVGSISIEDTGPMSVVAPWLTPKLASIRKAQSADVVFVSADGYKQRRVERRGQGRSWSVVEYQSDNGPFIAGRTANVRLKAGGYSGNTTLTADSAFFKSTHVGALFTLFTTEYEWSFKLAAQDTWTDAVRIDGIENSATVHERDYFYKVGGTFVGTLNLQSSTEGKDGPFVATNVEGGAAGLVITDTGTFLKATDAENTVLNNISQWVRVGFDAEKYTSGVATVQFQADDTGAPGYKGNGESGVFRVTGYTSPTSVQVEVIKPTSTLEYTKDWRESAWSDKQGWPSDVTLYEGRLWWHGLATTWGSVSDDYNNFDEEVIGDAGVVIRELGEGPVNNVQFSIGLSRLLLGDASKVITLRSTSFDEPLTNTNVTTKVVTTQGAANLPALQVDNRALYISASGERRFDIYYDVQISDFQVRDLTILAPEVLKGGVVDIAVQRQPDTRFHCVLADGSVAILTYEPDEELVCWSKWQSDTGTNSLVERVAVLPGASEDEIYYFVNRTINGATKRFLEKWAAETESVGDTGLSWISDCAVAYDGVATTTPTGFDHLEGEGLVLWGNDTGSTTHGKDLSPDDTGGTITLHTVAGGTVSALATSQKHVVAGLPFVADWKSTKLAYGSQAGTALAQKKRVDHIAFVMADVHNNALFFGRDFEHLDPMPRMIGRDTSDTGGVDIDKVFATFDEVSMPYPGFWDTDSRVVLRAKAPRPITMLAMVPTIEENDRL